MTNQTKSQRFETTNKLSECIEIAIQDLEACELDPDIQINMDYWYLRDKDADGYPYCTVCLAGAVMAKNDLEYQLSSLDPSNVPRELMPFNYKCEDRLRALNYVRDGLITSAIECFYNIELDTNIIRDVVDYKRNPKLFKIHLLEIVEYLKSLGY